MMYMKKNSILFNITILLLTAVFSTAFISCNTTKEIPEDLSAPQLLRKGQLALDSSDYKLAERCFLKTIEKYGDDTNIYIETKYEMGHLYIKTKEYRKAWYAFDEILDLYDYDSSNSLPPAYKKLARIEMEKIPPKLVEEYEAESSQN